MENQAPSETTPEIPGEPITTPSRSSRERPKWLTFLFELLQTIVMAVVLYFLIDAVIARVRVENISMEPTLQPGEFIMVNRLAYRLGALDRGDIIVFHYPLNPAEDYIKRVIGLSGDTISASGGVVYVNGNPLTESYTAARPQYNPGSWVVPADSVFVLGDNRNSSDDSRRWGYVPTSYIVGRALVVYWPFTDAKILSHPDIVKASP